MATAEVPEYCFEWEIHSPFLPWRRMEASFYLGYPTVTQWKVIIDPRDHRLNTWEFLFLLKHVKLSNRESNVLADKVKVDIFLNEKLKASREKNNRYFHGRNSYEFHFKFTVVALPVLEDWHVLTIRVWITLPGYPFNPGRDGLFFDCMDVMYLSEDMKKLRCFEDVRLLSASGTETHVHSFIMQARWDNFFKKHNAIAAIRRGVRTKISANLLCDILTYIYSGSLSTRWPDWESVPYMTELFQVIERYHLYHLYKVFVKNDFFQVRRTGQDFTCDHLTFCLDNARGERLNNPSFTTIVFQEDTHRYEFQLRIEFHMNAADPWFTYCLKSRSPHRIYAQVNMTLKKKRTRMEESRRQRLPDELIATVHEQLYTINSREEVWSGSCHFEEPPEGLREFLSGINTSTITEIHQYCISFVLNLSRGTQVFQVACVHDNVYDNYPQFDLINFNILSGHMRSLLQEPCFSDLQISCPNPNNPEGSEDCYPIHRAIFAARVPRWREVFGNITEETRIPRTARFSVRSDVFYSVLEYIYTGKVSGYPLPYLDELDRYAQEIGLRALRTMVSDMRTGHSRSLR